MDYNPPSGSTDPNASYVGKTASTQGSKVPPKAAEFPQREIVNAEKGALLPPTNGDLTQLLQAISRGIWLGALGGTANAITGALGGGSTPIVIPALLRGMRVRGTIVSTNTGPVTLSLTGVGGTSAVNYPVLRSDGTPVQAGDLRQGQSVTFEADGAGNLSMGLARSEIGAQAGASGLVVQIVQGPILYVRLDGSDAGNANDGSANDAAHAFATVAAAIKYGLARYNLAGQTLTIQLGAPGTYVFPGTIPAGAGKILIKGDPANIGGYAMSGAGPGGGGQACMVVDGARVAVDGVTLSNTGQNNHTISAIGGGACTVTNCLLAMPAGSNAYSHLFAGASGSISVGAGVSTSGNAAAFANATGGSITIAGVTVTVLGNPFYAFAFAVAQGVGSLGLLPGANFSGSATGARFYVGRVGYIQTSGAGGNVFPGSSAGTVDGATFGVLN